MSRDDHDKHDLVRWIFEGKNYVICMLKRNLKKEKKEWIFVNNVRDVAEPEEF